MCSIEKIVYPKCQPAQAKNTAKKYTPDAPGFGPECGFEI
jgi:hypothetical protein